MSDIKYLYNIMFDRQIPDQTSVSRASNASGQSDFLKLLIAQMSYQAPLDTQEVADASFITKEASCFNALIGTLNSRPVQVNQALQASVMVGRKVHIENRTSMLDPNNGLQGSVNVPEPVTDLMVYIHHLDGRTIKTISLGVQPAGIADFTWNGRSHTGNLLSTGLYGLRAEAMINEKSVILPTNAVYHVDSVTLEQGKQRILLNLREAGTVTLSEIKKFV